LKTLVPAGRVSTAMAPSRCDMTSLLWTRPGKREERSMVKVLHPTSSPLSFFFLLLALLGGQFTFPCLLLEPLAFGLLILLALSFLLTVHWGHDTTTTDICEQASLSADHQFLLGLGRTSSRAEMTPHIIVYSLDVGGCLVLRSCVSMPAKCVMVLNAYPWSTRKACLFALYAISVVSLDTRE